MGRGRENSSNCNPVYAKIMLKSGDEVDPRFELTIPNPDFGQPGEEKVIPDGRESGLFGKLIGVSAREFDYKGDKKLSGKIILEDADANEVYHISFGQSSIARNLINSLAGIRKPGVINLSLYNNKRGYATIQVTNDGEKTEWAWHPGSDQDNEYTRKIDWVYDKKKQKDVPDYWDLDKWLFEEVLVNQVGAVVKAARSEDPDEETQVTREPQPSVANATDAPVANATDAPVANATDNTDDLPF